MATRTTRKSGENHAVRFGTVLLGTARRTTWELVIRTAEARGSGDAGPVDKEIGLASGQVRTEYLITDEATLGLLGTYGALTVADSSGTTVFAADCLCRQLTRRENHDDLTVIDAVFVVQGLPSVPDLSALAFS